MVKKYSDNYRLDIAYATIFRNLEPIEEISIHTALNITSGDNLTKKEMVSGTHIVYGGGGETGNTHSEFNVDYKTIGIGRVGARCGCVFEIIPNSWVTDNALMIQSYDQRFSLDFLRHFLSYSELGQYANNSMQPVISKTRIKDVNIPLIDLQEQNALSKILDSIEKKEKFESNDYDLLKSKIKIIDNWETLNVEIEIQNNLTAQLKQSILQEAIQGKLTVDWRVQNPNTEPASELLNRIKAEKELLIKGKKIRKEKSLPPITEEEIPFGLPEGWVWCRLDDLTTINGGFAFKSSQYINEGVRVIRISDFNEDGFSNNKIVRYKYTYELEPYILKEENILMAMTGGTVGKSLLVKDLPEIMVVNQRVATINILSPISPSYINCVIPTNLVQNIIKEAKNSTNDNISMGNIKAFLIPLPPLEEQKAIVEKVETLMQKCQALEEEIKTSEANAQMLMQAV